MHDDDPEDPELAAELAELMEHLEAAHKEDPDSVRDAHRKALDDRAADFVEGVKSRFADTLEFLSRPVGSYNYDDLLRLTACSQMLLLLCAAGYTRRTIATTPLDDSPVGTIRAEVRKIAAEALADVHATMAFLSRDPSEYTPKELQKAQALAFASVFVIGIGDFEPPVAAKSD